MPEGKHIIVFNSLGLSKHGVIAERGLELRAHEVITGARLGENSKMDLEPEEVDEKGDDNQSERTSSEMGTKLE